MRLGLNERLFLITTLGLLGTMTVVFFFTYRAFEQMMEARFREKMQFLARHLSSSAILALAFRDQRALEQMAKEVLKEEEVTGVKIEDAQGKLLVFLGSPSPQDLILKKQVISRVPEEGFVFGEKKIQLLGQVTIYYSTASFERRMRALLLQSLLVGLFCFLLVDLILYLLVSRAVTQPLRRLVEGVRRVQAGKLVFDPPNVSLPEVQELSEAFAEMVTSLKKSREALARSYEEMLRNKTLAEVGRFSLMIAHEIKNPLGIIKGALDILRKENVAAELREQMISYIEEEIARIDTLVKSFLTFARPKKLHFEEFDLGELLEAVIRKISLEEGKQLLHFEREGNLQFLGDPSWLEQVFFNLINNAFEAGAQNVWLRAQGLEDEILIEVWDDGPGIPEEKKKEVFKPFYTEKTRGGLGLGLAIVEQIVRSHGGSITLEDHPEGGALFRLRFPRQGKTSA